MNVLLLAIIVERSTELITSSEISNMIFKNRLKSYLFDPSAPPYDSLLRRFLLFFDKVTSCGYCCSVWVAFVVTIFSPVYFDVLIFDVVLLHGLSNLYHVLYELLRRGRINTYDVDLKVQSTGKYFEDTAQSQD
jgi:hypothetical protein